MSKVCTDCDQVFTPHIHGGNNACHKCHLSQPSLYGKVGSCAMCMSPCKGTALVHKPSVPSSKPIPLTPIPSLTSSDPHEFYPCQVRLVSEAHGLRAQFPQQISYNEQTYHISGKLRRWLGEVQTHPATKLVKSLADSGAVYISRARWRQNGGKIRFQIPGPRYNKGWGALFEVVGKVPMPKSVGKGASAAGPPTLKPGDVVEFITSDSQAVWAGLDKGLLRLGFHPNYTVSGNIAGQVNGAFFTLAKFPTLWAPVSAVKLKDGEKPLGVPPYPCVRCGASCGKGFGGCWTSTGHGPLPHCTNCHIKLLAQKVMYSTEHPCPSCATCISYLEHGVCPVHHSTHTEPT